MLTEDTQSSHRASDLNSAEVKRLIAMLSPKAEVEKLLDVIKRLV